ncbi:MAG TPA: antibiotic biosynthesis monooxygenase [Stellaceae bacterium]|nr:antibiotic biosynthesis monooxygenase [Stellaceae bacterium]
MFCVIFEVQPHPAQWEAYLGNARLLRPELERIDGFIDNIRYRSLTRDGWILSLSSWRDEKSVIRWRTRPQHHEAQQRGRGEILADYHLRVGEITADTRLPEGCRVVEQRLDETETGAARAVMLVDAKRPATLAQNAAADAVARSLGHDPGAQGLVGWDVFDAVLTPGELILMMSWRDPDAATRFALSASLPHDARLRQIRIIRDYGMFDRREAPQYHLPATRHLS